MEFGKVSQDQLAKIDLSLPPTDPLTSTYLSNRSSDLAPRVRIGAPAWAHKEWIGSAYPLDAKPADFLYHYARAFSCVELNTVHYRIPTETQARKWLSQVTPEFIFYPKVFKDISHTRSGLLDARLHQTWFSFLNVLGAHGGASFLQFPPHFDYGDKALLFKFLQMWPSEFKLALEFRHPSWFVDHKILPALVEFLHKRGVGLVITDVAGRRDVLHTSVPAPFTMIRFIGNDMHPTDLVRARAWSERLKFWKGLDDIIFFSHQPDDLKTPEIVPLLREILAQVGPTL